MKADEFDKKFDAGEDVMADLDLIEERLEDAVVREAARRTLDKSEW